jgi:PhnB protein
MREMSAGKKVSVQPYIFFNGRCEEALNYYQRSLDAKIETIIRYKDNPEKTTPPGMKNKIMHANFRIGETQIMASDGNAITATPSFEGFALSVNAPTEAQADCLFTGLSDGGAVVMPLNKTFYSPRFGMVVDRFGILWMIIAAPE